MDRRRKQDIPGNVGETNTSIVDAVILLTRGQKRGAPRPKYVRPLVGALLGLALLLGAAAAPGPPPGAPAKPVVYVAPVQGVIDLGLVPYVDRVLAEAATAGAAAVILQIDTFGGRVDAAVQIRDSLLRSPLRTVAFVDKRAISAGALISLAATTLAMAEGGTIGAATPVMAGAPGAAPQPVAEKTVSYMRKEFRATAEHRGRPPLFAEAMVDADVAIPRVIAKGKLLTLTTAEALQHKVAELRAADLPALLAALDLAGAEVRRVSETWAESLVRFLTHPVLSSLLMTVGLLGIIIEVRTPGFGVPGTVGIASLGLFFWGHYLVRLAGWEVLLLLALGVGLLGVELFVLPGFGVTGVLGIGAILGSLTLTLVGSGATAEAMAWAAFRVLGSVLAAIGVGLVAFRVLPRSSVGRRLVLDTALPAQGGFASPPATDRAWLGQRGVAATTLRPAGIATIAGTRVDVVTDGEYVELGEPIEVLRVDGNRIVVRRVAGTGEGRTA
ncbi:MAG: nodulation protein NfeD [Zetaproteobacteria bacterium]|nr:MAG: nodulation protein NfeD [Zetaproteobacteria bacterium]